MAPIRPPKITAEVTTARSIMPPPTVAATAVPKPNAARKLKIAAQMTAWPGVSTRVETTVAIELAASWKPLMKSKMSATAISAEDRQQRGIHALAVLDDHAFEQIADVLAAVGRRLEEVEDLLPLDDGDRIALLVEERDDGVLVDAVGLALELVDARGQLEDAVPSLERGVSASVMRSVASQTMSGQVPAPGRTSVIL